MPHMDWQIHSYTQICADAMRETGCPGAIYTRKSVMCRAIAIAVNVGGGVEVQGFARSVGKGCALAEETLRIEIGKLLESDDLSV